MNIIKYFIPSSIRGQLVVFISILVLLQIVITATIFQNYIADYLKEQIGKRAVSIAETIAFMPEVREALLNGDESGRIQNLTEGIREKVKAQFIVAAHKDGVRISHPNPENIGKKFVGGDYFRAVESGESYYSESVGTLGASLRGFAPVFDGGNTIGFVSVGYLQSGVNEKIYSAQRRPAVYVFMMILAGLISAELIAGYIKKITLGLEPVEIASLHKEREIILNNVPAGIISVNAAGEVQYANAKSLDMLSKDGEGIKGMNIDGFVPEVYVMDRLNALSPVFDEEVEIGGAEIILNIIPVVHKEILHGGVLTIRRLDEMHYLQKELGRVRECSELLRVQSHEYSNKLHTIGGLLQLEEYDEAKDIILKESAGYHELLEFLDTSIKCPVINGMIIGKYNRAAELKIEMNVLHGGGWSVPPERPADVITVLANLIDNAMESARGKKGADGEVYLYMYEEDKALCAVVEDNGYGIPAENRDKIFNLGFSTKGDGRGIGMFNVKKSLESFGGNINISESGHGGAQFIVEIPKKGGAK